MIQISMLHVLSLDVFCSSKSWSGFKPHFPWKHQQKFDVAILEVPNQDASDEISPSCNSQNLIDMHCSNFAINFMLRLKIPASKYLTKPEILME